MRAFLPSLVLCGCVLSVGCPVELPDAWPRVPDHEPRRTPPPSRPPEAIQGARLSAAEARLLDLANGERTRRGLPRLLLDTRLVELARSHSEDMATNRFFSHTSPRNGGMRARLKAGGYSARTAGENLAYASTVEEIHRNLMSSAGHRANLLSEDFSHIGIGIFPRPAGGLLVTQLFALPRERN